MHKYLDMDLGLSLPQLVLYTRSSHNFKKDSGFEFLEIAHQTAGIGCNQRQIFGTILTPSPATKKAMEILTKKWLDSNVGVFGVNLDEVNIYRADLKLLFGCDCKFSYPEFEEAFYPIDLGKTTISDLCLDNLPEDLDTLIDFATPLMRAAGSIGRWHLAILGENCD